MLFSSKKIIILETVDSTNNYAMAMIQNGLEAAGSAVFAMEQTHGKGRRGKDWKSNKGENIILSIPVKMQWLPVFRQFELSAAVALACHDLVAKYCAASFEKQIFSVKIKWPNDIFINDRKAGGILIENILSGTLWQWSVIGIGININQEEFKLYNLAATSLKKVSGKKYDVIELAGELYALVLKRIAELQSGNFSKMLEEYNENLYAKKQLVKLKKQNIGFETTITGVAEDGRLITRDAFERRFNFDEVEFKGIV